MNETPFNNYELELAYQFIQYTNDNLFLTGNAGTGKTTFLHNLRLICKKKMIVLAPTGVAAINANGETIHSFFQLPFTPFIPKQEKQINQLDNNYESVNNYENIDNYKFNKKNYVYFRYKHETKSLNKADVYVNRLMETNKDNFRLNGTLQLSPSFKYKFRVEYVNYRKGSDYNHNGYAVSQTLSFKQTKLPVSFHFTFVYFDTYSYDERIYGYENDVLYAYSFPSYYYQGARYVFNIKYTINKKISILCIGKRLMR